MPSQSLLLAAFLATTALAAPAFQSSRKVIPRDTTCLELDEGGNPHVATVEFYDNKDCTGDTLSNLCYYAFQATIDAGSSAYSCAAAGLPDSSPFYAKLTDSPFPDLQLLYTRDQSCPPNGAGAVFVSMINKQNCVMFNIAGDVPGLSIYPNGGSGMTRKAKRADAKCDGFTVESKENSYSPSVQVSEIIDCLNGAESGCEISEEKSHTESVSTSFSATAGGGIEGVFSVSATFGTEYTTEDTTSIQKGLSIPQGQKAYLSAYSGATLFKGKFTGCDSGDAEQPGQVLAIKKNTFTYLIVNSNSFDEDGVTV
jgi:hypothetical protein